MQAYFISLRLFCILLPIYCFFTLQLHYWFEINYY